MTISISSVGLNRFKPQPKTIYQAIAEGKVIPDAVEGAKNAKASAAFFNAQGMMKRGVEDQAKATVKGNVFNNLFNKAKKSKAGQKLSGLFGKAKDSKIGQKTSKAVNTVAEETKTIISKPGVKKGLKYAGIGLLALGGLALVGYLGKKAYDAYQKRQNDKADANPVTTVPSGVHDVKKGDNVWNIAKKDLENKGVEVTNAEIAKRTEELMKLNNLKYANDKGLVIIKPGQQIKLS